MEVKNRVRDLFEGFRQCTDSDDATTATSPEPAHDPSILFRSIEKMFPRRQTSEAVQGAWIKTGVKQEETELRNAFGQLDAERVHFAVLGDWDEDAYVLANNDETKNFVTLILGIRESRRFVFQRGVLPSE